LVTNTLTREKFL